MRGTRVKALRRLTRKLLAERKGPQIEGAPLKGVVRAVRKNWIRFKRGF